MVKHSVSSHRTAPAVRFGIWSYPCFTAWAIRAYHLQVYQYLSEIGGSRPTFFFARRTDAILSAISMIMKATNRIPDRRVVRPLTARILRSFLAALERSRHHIYALWEHASILSFAIKNADGEYLSLREFFGRGDAVAPADPLIVIFHEVHIETVEELTAEYIERIYESFLYHHCEMGLRCNAPLRLTSESIRRYGLTEADAILVGEHLEVLNEMIRRKLQQRYDELKALYCIRE